MRAASSPPNADDRSLLYERLPMPVVTGGAYRGALLRYVKIDVETSKGGVLMIEVLDMYRTYLVERERSASTIRQYVRDVESFLRETGDGGPMTKAKVIAYKEDLCGRYRISSVNTKLAAINSFLEFTGRSDMKVKCLKMQRRPYSPQEKELTKSEYLRLVDSAKRSGDERLALIVQTLGGTGIRVSELRYITVEAVRRGEAYVWLKGKNRVILIAGKLRKLLRGYISANGLVTGPVFVTRGRKPIDRSNVWKMLKRLGEKAGVEAAKIFPHNIRHLFARCFYEREKDIAKLADVLGHSSINTTRVYIITSGYEHRRMLDALGLVV